MRLFNEFTAGSDLLRIWPRTTTPNSIAAFSMIHLLYDRVDRDSALINDPVPSLPTPRRQLSLSRIREEARNRAGKEGGEEGGGEKEERFEFFVARHVRTYVSVLFLSGGRRGGSRFIEGSFRFRPPPPSLPSITRDRWAISTGHSDNGIRSFVGSFGRSTDPARRVRETRLIVYTMQIEYPLNDSLDPIDLEIGYKR